MANLNSILEGLQGLVGRPSPYSEISVEIKDKVVSSRARVGNLSEYHINDMIKTRKEVTEFYLNEGSEQEQLVGQFRRLEPRIAPIEDDPFI